MSEVALREIIDTAGLGDLFDELTARAEKAEAALQDVRDKTGTGGDHIEDSDLGTAIEEGINGQAMTIKRLVAERDELRTNTQDYVRELLARATKAEAERDELMHELEGRC
jgi:hypothetical protein